MSEFIAKEYLPDQLAYKTSENKNKIDKELNEEYRQAFFGEDFEYLGGKKDFRDAQLEKIKLGNGNIELDYSKLENIQILDSYENKLVALRQKVRVQEESVKNKGDVRIRFIDSKETKYIENKMLENDRNIDQETVLKNIYRWKINEDLAQIRMLKCASEARKLKLQLNNVEKPEEKAKIEQEINTNDRNFDRYSSFIYGEPQKELFDYFRINIIDKCDKVQVQDEYPEEIKNIAYDLKKDLSKDIDKIDHKNIFTKLPNVNLSDVNSGETINFQPEQFKELVESALNEVGADDDWSVVIDKNKTVMSVSQKEKNIYVPGTDRKININRIKSLIRHEIGTHVQRRLNGERSNLLLLATGVDRYNPGEEAAATYNEQKTEGFREFAGADRYLSIGLVKGMDAAKDKKDKTHEDYRNFLELYNILNKYYAITQYEKVKDVQQAKNKAQVDAFNRCVRTFRGINNLQNKNGYCFSRDMIYANNINLWRLINKNGDQEENIYLGKFDPTNNRHEFVLSVLGITDDELEKLKNNQ